MGGGERNDARFRCDPSPGRDRAEGEEVREARLQELEEMAAKLLATARALLPGQDRHNALQEVGRFRTRITALRRSDLRSAYRKLKAKAAKA